MTASDEAWVQRLEDLTEALEALVEDRGILAVLDTEQRQRLLTAAGRLSKPDGKARRRLNKEFRKRKKVAKRDQERALLDQTRIRVMRSNPLFETPRRRGDLPDELPPPLGDVEEGRVCYVCRNRYTSIHFFYDQMCPECGDFNYRKRHQTADLTGRVALITGARVKIGYQAAIMLLRAGAYVVVVTRFPQDAARRYAAESDFDEWGDRLEIHGVDLRRTPAVEALCETLVKRLPRLDFVINNACQTVRRPVGFYDHLLQAELAPKQISDAASALVAPPSDPIPSAALAAIPLLSDDRAPMATWFPTGQLDADAQQVDLREVNSWRLKLDEVPTIELLEVQLVNAVAPYVLNARLRPLMQRTPGADKHIVNVSAMEGQFYRTFKSDRHPHTNMAKAALNMMTRTSAADYVEDGIHMNSVDTGWVTDEDPVNHAESKREMHDFSPPLDIVDGAARIIDPIFDGLNTGKHVWGQFLKDYRITDW